MIEQMIRSTNKKSKVWNTWKNNKMFKNTPPKTILILFIGWLKFQSTYAYVLTQSGINRATFNHLWIF